MSTPTEKPKMVRTRPTPKLEPVEPRSMLPVWAIATPTATPVNKDTMIKRRDVSNGHRTTNRRLTRISKNSDQQGMFSGKISFTGCAEKFGRKNRASATACERLDESQFWLLRPCKLAHVTTMPNNAPARYSG